MIRRLAADELERIGEIDRSEEISQMYRSRDGELELVDVAISAPRWGEPGTHTVEYYIRSCAEHVEAGGVAVGAFDGDRLVGFAVYEPEGLEGFANLAVLHVTRSHRGTGVGGALTKEIVRLAREDDARRLYVSATPTRATVDFYMRQGFVPLVTPDPRMFAREPEDIHLEMPL